MTAEQARELAAANGRKLESILADIEFSAKQGYYSTGADRVTAEIKLTLEGLGYKVTDFDVVGYVKISWEV